MHVRRFPIWILECVRLAIVTTRAFGSFFFNYVSILQVGMSVLCCQCQNHLEKQQPLIHVSEVIAVLTACLYASSHFFFNVTCEDLT